MSPPENIIQRQVTIFLLTVLQAILNEQYGAGLISKETVDYIYAALRDQAVQLGWIE